MHSNIIPSMKVVFVGNTGVGKSSIATRYARDFFDDFNSSTIGAAFFNKNIIHKEKPVKMEIWDTAGQEKYHCLASMYYRGAAAAIIVYDITSTDSYTKAKKWYTELKENLNEKAVIVLVGNKCDMEDEREVPSNISDSFFDNIFHIETSAKSNLGIEKVFQHILNNAIFNIPKSNNIILPKSKKKCCY